MRNAGLEETEAGIKIAGRNINNLRYADDTTLMAFCRCRRVADAYSGFVGVDLPWKMGDSRSYISTPFILVSFATSQNSCHSMPSQFWMEKESFIVLYGPPYASS